MLFRSKIILIFLLKVVVAAVEDLMPECFIIGGNLAGSILQLKDGAKHVVDWGLVTVAQALQMATSVPAKSVGLENTCGSLKVGLPADFIVLDDSLDLQATYVDGQKGWEK